MNINFEQILKKTLQGSAGRPHKKTIGKCLTDEDIAAIIEGKIQEEESPQYMDHLSTCQTCALALKENFLLARAMQEKPMMEPPHYLVQDAINLYNPAESLGILEIVLNFKQKFIELVQTTGEILIGQELVPVAVLRGKEEDKLQNDIKVVKTFNGILTEVNIEKRNPSLCNIEMRLTEKNTKKKAQGIRVTLSKNNREIESALSQDGKVLFREVSADKYNINIVKENKTIGTVKLSINPAS